jgi:hypothetical protein
MAAANPRWGAPRIHGARLKLGIFNERLHPILRIPGWVKRKAQAHERGVRALNGEAVSTRLRKDRIYAITLRSTGELTIQPTP